MFSPQHLINNMEDLLFKKKHIFNEILTDGKWNKFSIGDDKAEWVNSLSDEEYEIVRHSLVYVRNSLITFATEGVVQSKPNFEQIPDGEPKCDLVPFLGYRSGKLKVTSVYYPEKYFKVINEYHPPSGINTRLRCICNVIVVVNVIIMFMESNKKRLPIVDVREKLFPQHL